MIDMDEREEQAEAQAPAKKKKKGGGIVKWLIIVFALILLTAAGFFGFRYFKAFFPSKETGPVKQEAKADFQELLWPMGTVIVNLVDEDGRRYLKATIGVEVSRKEMVTELESIKPKIMDSVLDLLSSKSYKEIVGYEAKQRLKDEIAERVNINLSGGTITKVYFTEFIIQ